MSSLDSIESAEDDARSALFRQGIASSPVAKFPTNIGQLVDDALQLPTDIGKKAERDNDGNDLENGKNTAIAHESPLPVLILHPLPPPPSGHVWMIGGKWLPDGTLDTSPETFRALRQPWENQHPKRIETK